MKKAILILSLSFSLAAAAQTAKKETPKADSVQLTMQTKFISVEDIYRKADILKDSVTARNYELMMFGIDAILKELIAEWHRKKN